MKDLIDFLRARVDDRAAFARMARLAKRHVGQMLREVERDRSIIHLHAPWQSGFKYTDPDTRVPDLRCSVCHDRDDVDHDRQPCAVEWPCPTLRLMALPYADHRDYRQEWLAGIDLEESTE